MHHAADPSVLGDFGMVRQWRNSVYDSTFFSFCQSIFENTTDLARLISLFSKTRKQTPERKHTAERKTPTGQPKRASRQASVLLSFGSSPPRFPLFLFVCQGAFLSFAMTPVLPMRSNSGTHPRHATSYLARPFGSCHLPILQQRLTKLLCRMPSNASMRRATRSYLTFVWCRRI